MRRDKISEALKRQVSNIIHDELKDPRIGFITITRVEMSADLRFGRIYYSVLGDSNAKKNTGLVLESAAGFIRHAIGQRLNLRFVPEIVFKRDDSCEYSIHIQEELDRLKENHEPKKSRRANKEK